MIGIWLSILGALFGEISFSLEKEVLTTRLRRLAALGFLQSAVSFLFYAGYAVLVPGSLVFSWASLPTVIAGLILDIAQTFVVLYAIAKADRSSFGFVRTLSLPLLLIVDLLLGYPLRTGQIIGVILIFSFLALLTAGHGLRKRGIWLVLFSAVNSAATVSLYKYNITHFNSVTMAQGTTYFFITLSFAMTCIFWRESPFKILRQPKASGSIISSGLSALVSGFAYRFGPASLILAIQRAAGVFWAVIAGRARFHETHFRIKAASLIGCILGIALLILG
ncbi:MAG TPA: hypothetical protein VFQ60_00475 [Patescibacteria group bacterium]|nr:hypothetical protein [Patescibacteria group bacterium]